VLVEVRGRAVARSECVGGGAVLPLRIEGERASSWLLLLRSRGKRERVRRRLWALGRAAGGAVKDGGGSGAADTN
jgi:hypothetical protein